MAVVLALWASQFLEPSSSDEVSCSDGHDLNGQLAQDRKNLSVSYFSSLSTTRKQHLGSSLMDHKWSPDYLLLPCFSDSVC